MKKCVYCAGVRMLKAKIVEFFVKYFPLVVTITKSTKISPYFILSVSALETEYGCSRPGVTIPPPLISNQLPGVFISPGKTICCQIEFVFTLFPFSCRISFTQYCLLWGTNERFFKSFPDYLDSFNCFSSTCWSACF